MGMIFFMKRYLATLAALALCSCAPLNPAQKSDVKGILSSVTNAAVSYATGNIAGTVLAGIQGTSYFIRALQDGTPKAASPTAIAAAVKAGTAPAALAPVVATAIAKVVATGQTPAAANELVAGALDVAAAQITAKLAQ